MKRVDIYYGGEKYSVGNVDFDDVRLTIARALADGGDWVEVNYGDGEPRVAHLLVSPGVPIAIVPIAGDGGHLTPVVDISETLVPS